MTIAAANTDKKTSDFVRDLLESGCLQVEQAKIDRMDEVMTKSGKHIIEPKYFEAEGLTLEITCPICDKVFLVDFGENGFLEYPEVEKWCAFSAVGDCGHEFDVQYKLDLQATISIKVAK